jgi:hypothetical protein
LNYRRLKACGLQVCAEAAVFSDASAHLMFKMHANCPNHKHVGNRLAREAIATAAIPVSQEPT